MITKGRYELHIEGEIIKSTSLKELKNIAKNTLCYYEIFTYVKSNPGMSTSGNLKLKLSDMQDAAMLINKGCSKQITARKFHVNPDHLMRVLRKNHLVV